MYIHKLAVASGRIGGIYIHKLVVTRGRRNIHIHQLADQLASLRTRLIIHPTTRCIGLYTYIVISSSLHTYIWSTCLSHRFSLLYTYIYGPSIFITDILVLVPKPAVGFTTRFSSLSSLIHLNIRFSLATLFYICPNSLAKQR